MKPFQWKPHRRVLVFGVAFFIACKPADHDTPAAPTTGPVETSPVDSPEAPDSLISAEPPPSAPGLWFPPVACGTVLPGPALPSDSDEAQPGYAEALAALDVTAVPEPFDFSGNNPLQRILINYMLYRIGGQTTFTRADIDAAGPLGKAVLAAAAAASPALPNKINMRMLVRGLAYAYPCARAVPSTLEGFKRRFGDYSTWSHRQTVACSPAKNGPRRLSVDLEQGVHVAETLEEGFVRETEVIFTRLREDGNLDFAVYTEDGQLSDRSTFAGARPEGYVGSSPYQCIACHMSPETLSVSNTFPSGGAGCKK